MKELSLNILDIVQNSIRAEATLISIGIRESFRDNIYEIIISDNGKGIDEKILENVTNPFITTRTKRRMGLGLPLLKYHAEIAGGELKIESEKGKGTVIRASFRLNHIDRQPLGDLAGVIKILLASNPCRDFLYQHVTTTGEYIFSSEETKDYLEAESLNNVDLLEDIGEMIRENQRAINASV